MPMKRAKPRKPLSKKERRRIKSAIPRRRVAKEAFRKRLFNEKNIVAKTTTIFDSFEPRDKNEPRQRQFLISRKSPLIVGRSGKKGGDLTLRVGNFYDPKTKIEVPIVAKVESYKFDDSYPDKYVVASGRSFLRDVEGLRKIATLGIPTVKFAKSINIESAKISRMQVFIIEDLSAGGRYKVEELPGFDFSGVSNATKLKVQANQYVSKILAQNPQPVGDKAHRKNPDLREEVEHCFFVVIDPKTKSGRLVAGDADHIEFFR